MNPWTIIGWIVLAWDDGRDRVFTIHHLRAESGRDVISSD